MTVENGMALRWSTKITGSAQVMMFPPISRMSPSAGSIGNVGAISLSLNYLRPELPVASAVAEGTSCFAGEGNLR
jgi:hypothetical protein